MERSEVLKLLEVYDIEELIEIGGWNDLADLLVYLYEENILVPPEVRPL